MHFELRQAEGRLAFELSEGCIVLGGHAGADVQVSALEDHSVRVWVEGGQWSFMSGRETEVSGAPLYAQVRRLVLPGEAVRLGPGLELRALDDFAPGTETAASQTHSLLKLWLDPGPPPGPFLTCLTGLDAGRVFAMAPHQPSVLGRALTADIRLRDRAVSRVQAHAELREGRCWLRVEPGANPLLLNGAPLSAPTALESGDLISVGYSQLRYVEPPKQPMAEGLDPADLDVDVALNEVEGDGTRGDEATQEPDREDGLLEAESTWKRIAGTDWRWLLAGALLVALGVYLRVQA